MWQDIRALRFMMHGQSSVGPAQSAEEYKMGSLMVPLSQDV
jgi:hypothetical protein